MTNTFHRPSVPITKATSSGSRMYVKMSGSEVKYFRMDWFPKALLTASFPWIRGVLPTLSTQLTKMYVALYPPAYSTRLRSSGFEGT